jgi:hypothetical protein
MLAFRDMRDAQPHDLVRAQRGDVPAAKYDLAVAVDQYPGERPEQGGLARAVRPEQRDELAPLHYSITSSARPDRGSGTVMPSALAVLRLMKSSTLVACWTGRSAGFSPFRTRPV